MFVKIQLLCIICVLFHVYSQKKSETVLNKINYFFLVVALAFVGNYGLNILPMPTEELTIRALGEKSELSKAEEISLTGFLYDDIEYHNIKVLDGKWFWAGNNYMWRIETDERQPAGTTREITLAIPIGTHREAMFLVDEWRGKAEIIFEGNTQLIDFGPGNETNIKIPDSDLFTLRLAKALRLLAWFSFIIIGTFVILHKFKYSHIIFLLTYSLFYSLLSRSSPLSNDLPRTDSSVFMTIGKYMSEGFVPYVDMFDHKGPLLYFFNYVGWLFAGEFGIWLIEFSGIFINVLFSFMTAKLILKQNFLAYLITFLTHSLSVVPFENGNFTESFALPFMSISIYYFTKTYFNNFRFDKISPYVHGFCFIATILLRPNMFSIFAIFCFISYVYIFFIKEKDLLWILPLKFTLGMAILLLPTILYLWINDALADCLYQFISFNKEYSATSTIDVTITNLISKFLFYLEIPYIFYSLVLICIVTKIEKEEQLKIYSFSLFISFVVSILLISIANATYGHYRLVVFPLLTPIYALVLSKLKTLLFRSNYTFHKIDILLVSIVSFLLIGPYYYSNVISPYFTTVKAMSSSNNREKIQEVVHVIESNTNSDETFLVFGNQCMTYLFTDRKASSKYIYQSMALKFDNQIMLDMMKDLEECHSELLLIPSNLIANIEDHKISLNSPFAVFDAVINENYIIFETIQNFTILKINERGL